MKKLLTDIAFIFIVLICSCEVNGQNKKSKKEIKYDVTLTKEQVNVTTSPAGLSGITVTYNGSATKPTKAGSYTVKASITDRNYFGEKYKPKSSLLKYLPYAGIAVSILLAVFFFIRKRDEEITLPENYYNENDN